MSTDDPEVPEQRDHFRRTLVRVLGMQVFALLALYILQSIYAP